MIIINELATPPCRKTWTASVPNGASPLKSAKEAKLHSYSRRIQSGKQCFQGWGPDPNWFMIKPSRAHTRVFPDRNYRVWTEFWARYSLYDGLEMVWSEVNLVWKVWSEATSRAIGSDHNLFERTSVWSEAISSAIGSDHNLFERTWVWSEMFSNAIESDQGPIRASYFFLFCFFLLRDVGWSYMAANATGSDPKMLRAQLRRKITSSSALESDHSLIKVWAMVWIWVWTMVWRWSDQNAFGLKSLIRDPMCLDSLIRGVLGLESLIRVNFRLESLIRDNFGLESLIRRRFGSGPQPGIVIEKYTAQLELDIKTESTHKQTTYQEAERSRNKIDMASYNTTKEAQRKSNGKRTTFRGQKIMD